MPRRPRASTLRPAGRATPRPTPHHSSAGACFKVLPSPSPASSSKLTRSPLSLPVVCAGSLGGGVLHSLNPNDEVMFQKYYLERSAAMAQQQQRRPAARQQGPKMTSAPIKRARSDEMDCALKLQENGHAGADSASPAFSAASSAHLSIKDDYVPDQKTMQLAHYWGYVGAPDP
jgi:hypothetical protein